MESDFDNRGMIAWTPTSIFPKGRPGMSDVALLTGISGLSFDSLFQSPLNFCPVLLLFLSCHSANSPFSWLFSRKFSRESLRESFLLYGTCWVAWSWSSVGGTCNLLPNGAGIFTVGALNMQGFVWKFLCATYNFFYSFIRQAFTYIYKNKHVFIVSLHSVFLFFL